MINDAAFDEMSKPIIAVYDQIELELLKDIAERFKTYTSIGGTLEWYLKKLQEMGALTNQNISVISKLSGKSKQAIKDALKKASIANINEQWVDSGYDRGYSKVDYDTLMKSKSMADTFNNSFKSTKDTFKLINTKVLESAKKAYMDALNKAYIETLSGTKSYSESINEALKSLADNGITAATYARKDGTLVNYSIESVVRRDILTAAVQTANKSNLTALDEIGCEYVEVSSHLGARTGDGLEDYTNHSWWQGKAYKISGEAAGYPNLYEVTGYGEIQGLSGINCRHRMFGYWPGDELGAKQYDLEENAEYYKKTQQQRALERKVRQARREEAVALTPEDQKAAAAKRKAAVSNLDQFVKNNNLTRDYTRETIQEPKQRISEDEVKAVAKTDINQNAAANPASVMHMVTPETVNKAFSGSVDKTTNSATENSMGIAELIAENPKLLANYTPASLKEKLLEDGYTVHSLGRGALKGVLFEDGGGYRTSYKGDKYLQYHPEKGSHHNGEYYKTSSGKYGIKWYDKNGEEK